MTPLRIPGAYEPREMVNRPAPPIINQPMTLGQKVYAGTGLAMWVLLVALVWAAK